MSREKRESVVWMHCGEFFFLYIFSSHYCRPHFIKVSNKGLCYVVHGKCVVMFCSFGIDYKALGSSNAAGEQSACKCDVFYFTLVPGVNNNQWPKLDVSYMLYTYVICLIVL